MTQFGPVEVLVVAFPGSNFSGGIAPALRNVVENGSVNIIDLAFITKDNDETVTMLELDEIGDASVVALDEALEEVFDLLNDEDLLAIGEGLPPGSSAAAIVIEHKWARELAGAVADSDGQVVLNERIPREVVQAAFDALD